MRAARRLQVDSERVAAAGEEGMTAADIHYRKVLMTQARAFKARGSDFYLTLVMWARRRGRKVKTDPVQLEFPL